MMATNDCTIVNFLCTTDTEFYFEDAIPDLDEDTFSSSCCPVINKWIKSNDNKFLILEKDTFQAKNLNQQQCQQEDRFNLQIFKCSTTGLSGRAVMLYVIKDGKKKVVCCTDEHEVHPVEMEIPKHIQEDAHKAMFYQVKQQHTSNYLFESSLFPSEYLAFEPDSNDHRRSRLILRHKGKDEVDESAVISLIPGQ